MKPIYRKYVLIATLTWAACAIVCLLAYLLVLAPHKAKMKRVEKQFAEVKEAYHSSVEAAQEETKMRLSKETEELREKLKALVVDSEDLADLPFDIGEIAAHKEVTSFSIRGDDNQAARKKGDGQCINEHHMSISFSAGFNQFADLLNTLERNHPAIFVDEFTITRSKTEDVGHRVNMDATVYVKKQWDSQE